MQWPGPSEQPIVNVPSDTVTIGSAAPAVERLPERQAVVVASTGGGATITGRIFLDRIPSGRPRPR
jgi:hypothetical protein